MDCRDLEQLMDACWDRELPADQCVRIQTHLELCPDCRAAYGPLNAWLSSPEPVNVPAELRDRVLHAVLAAATEGSPASDMVGLPASHAVPVDRPRRFADWHRQPARHRFAPLAWMGALAACITVLFVSRPQMEKLDSHMAATPDPVAVPSMILAALQPNSIAAAGAAICQATAIDRMTRTQTELPLPLRMDRRPLRQDWVPADPSLAVQQLPAVMSAFSPLGA